MKHPIILLKYLLATALLAGSPISNGEAKSYSSGGGHSYSSSSHSSSSGGSRSSSSSGRSSSSGGSRSSSSSPSKSSPSPTRSSSSSGSKSSPTPPSRSSSSGTSGAKTFNSGSGKSYTSGSSWSDDSRKSYTSGKSYSSGSGINFSSGTSHDTPASPRTPARKSEPAASSLTLDSAAARARKEEASQRDFTRFKEASVPKPTATDPRAPLAPALSPSRGEGGPAPSYRVTPPPLPPSASGSYRRTVYVPDDYTLATRPVRVRTYFSPYISRPVVVYRDPYNSFFWWWLLDRSLDDRAYWAYHHRHDMDPARYQALVADNRELESRIQQLEAEQLPRNPNYVPPNLDRDLMYSDQQVTRAYSNRPTTSGSAMFWVLAIMAAAGAGFFLIWLIFFKRWQSATPSIA